MENSQGLISQKVDGLRIEILTLYLPHFSEETKTYIYIFCHSSTMTQHSLLKSFLM